MFGSKNGRNSNRGETEISSSKRKQQLKCLVLMRYNIEAYGRVRYTYAILTLALDAN
jgi:hypothetical protein